MTADIDPQCTRRNIVFLWWMKLEWHNQYVEFEICRCQISKSQKKQELTKRSDNTFIVIIGHLHLYNSRTGLAFSNHGVASFLFLVFLLFLLWCAKTLLDFGVWLGFGWYQLSLFIGENKPCRTSRWFLHLDTPNRGLFGFKILNFGLKT